MQDCFHLTQEDLKILDRFSKIYIHDNGEPSSEVLIKKVCKFITYDKIYTVSAKNVNYLCKEPSDLNLRKTLDLDLLLNSAKQINKNLYNVAISEDEDINSIPFPSTEKLAEHVKIANEIMDTMYIKFYNGNFYVYENRYI